MVEAVYLLCALTSATCALLLWRGWRRTGVRLLFYSGLCFVWLALNNAMLFIDLVLVPGIDLSLVRSATTVVGAATLLYGLVWDVS